MCENGAEVKLIGKPQSDTIRVALIEFNAVQLKFRIVEVQTKTQVQMLKCRVVGEAESEWSLAKPSSARK